MGSFKGWLLQTARWRIADQFRRRARQDRLSEALHAVNDRLAGDQATYRWLGYNAQAVAGVGDARVCVIRYEDWFTAPQAAITRLAAFVGVPDRPELVSVIDESLRHDALGAAEAVPTVAVSLFQQIAASGELFDARLQELAATILGCEHAVMPFLRDAALLPLSIAEQNRAIADLHGLIEQLRAKKKGKGKASGPF